MLIRPKLSKGQLNRTSEVFGNISVAWFSAGVISPLFIPSQNVIDFIVRFCISLVLAVFFLLLSIYLLKEKK